MSGGAKTSVILGTATPGGGFPLYGGAVAETINATDPSLNIEPRNTTGSTENVPLLEAGTLDIALVQGEVAYEALSGIGRAPADLKIIAAMYSTPGMFVVRADSQPRSIQDLRGKPVAFGAKGSPAVVMAIVFAGAPVVNAAVAIAMHPPEGGVSSIKWPFFAGLLLAAAGGCLVTLFRPGQPVAPRRAAAPVAVTVAAGPTPGAPTDRR